MGEREYERGGGGGGGRWVNANMHIFKISHPHNQKMHFFFIVEKRFHHTPGWRRG